MSFKLDARLEADTYWMGDLHLSRVLLMNDRRYPWIILVPMLEGLKELTDCQKSNRSLYCKNRVLYRNG